MTVAEACELVVDLTRELSAVRAERDSYRLVAVQAIHHLHEQYIELEQVRARYHRVLDESRAQRRAA